MTQKVLITSALPYANGPLHFGHIAGAYLPADCYARFERSKGANVLYVCGSDEHGVAITLKAEMEGRSPKEHVDLYHGVNKKLFDQLKISFDHFSRTTWEGHVEPTHQFFKDLVEVGAIDEAVTDQLYSEQDDKFLADRYVVGTCPYCNYEKARGDECPSCGQSYEAVDLKAPRSKISDAPLVRRATKHWFLRLDKFKDQLTEWIESKNWKPNVVNFVKSYIEGLRPRAITRDMKWGIPVPLEGAEGKVLYVWFDAPIGYISASKEYSLQQGNESLWEDHWFDPETKFVQFVGKDNIPFHAVIFPAMCMGQKQPYKLVDELPANEFYNLEGRQFSKSDGWYIDFEDFFKKYSSDQIRYTIAANAPETSDSEFTWKDFQCRCNAELLGKYGNLVNRVIVFCRKQCDGKVPEMGALEEVDRKFLEEMNRIVGECSESYSSFRLRRVCRRMMELAQVGNVYFNEKQPWKDAKSPETRVRMETTLTLCIECLKRLALLSAPVIPDTAEKVWEILGFEQSMTSYSWDEILSLSIEAGRILPEPEILFQKVEDEAIEKELEQLQAMNAKSIADSKEIKIEPFKEVITFDDFSQVDLRVGKIIEASAVPKSKKLLKVTVDLGSEKRVIVSGIRKFYDPSNVVGMKVIVVANLKPAKLMGIQSEGMILAASHDDSLELASVDSLPAGAVVS